MLLAVLGREKLPFEMQANGNYKDMKHVRALIAQSIEKNVDIHFQSLDQASRRPNNPGHP